MRKVQRRPDRRALAEGALLSGVGGVRGDVDEVGDASEGAPDGRRVGENRAVETTPQPEGLENFLVGASLAGQTAAVYVGGWRERWCTADCWGGGSRVAGDGEAGDGGSRVGPSAGLVGGARRRLWKAPCYRLARFRDVMPQR